MAGPYHFIVQSIDAAGNSTSFQNGTNVEIEIFLANNSMAVVSITNLENDKLEILPNIPFNVEGTIRDPDHPTLQGFNEVFISLGEDHEHGDHSGRLTLENVYEIEYEGAQLIPFEIEPGLLDLSSMIVFTPDNTFFDKINNEGIDELLLSIQVIDLQGNYTVSETLVLLKP